MSFVNEIYIFRHDVRQIIAIYVEKNVRSFRTAKAAHIFSAKNFSVLYHINVCILENLVIHILRLVKLLMLLNNLALVSMVTDLWQL